MWWWPSWISDSSYKCQIFKAVKLWGEVLKSSTISLMDLLWEIFIFQFVRKKLGSWWYVHCIIVNLPDWVAKQDIVEDFKTSWVMITPQFHRTWVKWCCTYCRHSFNYLSVSLQYILYFKCYKLINLSFLKELNFQRIYVLLLS